MHRFGDQIDQLPARLALGERVVIEETVKFTLSHDLTESFGSKLSAALN